MPFPELFFAFKTGLKSIIKMPIDRFRQRASDVGSHCFTATIMPIASSLNHSLYDV